jgi:hypothetical protein
MRKYEMHLLYELFKLPIGREFYIRNIFKFAFIRKIGPISFKLYTIR